MFKKLKTILPQFKTIPKPNVIKKIDGFDKEPDPNLILKNYIGPPDKESNLRPIIRFIPENETTTQKLFRLRCIEVENWNQNFWSNHNKRFYEEREKFINENKKSIDENLSADKMSEFYKAFLDQNWRMHFFYNISWYMKNFELLFLSTRVNIEKLALRK